MAASAIVLTTLCAIKCGTALLGAFSEPFSTAFAAVASTEREVTQSCLQFQTLHTDNFFFIGSSSFLVSSAACLVALTIGCKRVCNSSPIASFISRFIILRCLTVFIAVPYSLTRVALSAGSLMKRHVDSCTHSD